MANPKVVGCIPTEFEYVAVAYHELPSYFYCVSMLQIRWYAYRRPNEQPGLIGRFIENLKEGFERNKEMQVG